ncbi:phosphoribosylamine--glycine ligase [Croceimicrobium sp.]|uniref:phosphoribosylamine--glycine ligase n=1 Tax=Croceimicrobium sp. TaxID=2828340 RepID=UPI003BADADD2
MNILILGGGGREHALAWKIAQSADCDHLYLAPGNAGTAAFAKNIALSPEDFPALKLFCIQNSIDLVLVGPEAPLVAGVVDFFRQDDELKNVKIIGPAQAAAELEGSKKFAKEFMAKYQIPTAAYRSFSAGEVAEAETFLESLAAPYVLKADGLAAGKGVLILEDLQEAKAEAKAMLEGKFGAASKTLVIEEFLDGREYSVFALTDAKDHIILPVAKDYKRIGEGDTGPNTGGMGAVSPVSFVDDALWQKTVEQVVEPTIKGLSSESFDYVGFVFFGLIEVKGEPKVIEYNVRMGDPETEVVMPRLKSDLLKHLNAAAEGRLAEEKIEIHPEFCTTVMAVSEGYPGSYAKGKEITGLENVNDCIPFHAGTKLEEDKVLTSGGRVIALSAMGPNKEAALAKSYAAAKTICFEGIQYRKDIGFDL